MTRPPRTGAYDLPPLPWLRAFEASARHSNFTAAAEELHLTQAAVSHQVRSLEKHLGVALFERLPRRLRLTEIGTAYLPPLRRAFDELAASTAGLFGPVGRKTLVVRAPVSFMALWLAPRLPAFTAAWPQIGLRLNSAVWTDAVSDEASDVDIRFGDGHWPGFRAERIAADGAIAVCHPDLAPELANARGPSARMAALAARTLIHVTGSEDLWQRLLAPHDIALAPFAGVNVDTWVSALELAAAGFGPAMTLESFAAPYLATGRLVRAVDTVLPVSQSHYVLIAEGARRIRPETMLFRNWLRAEAAPVLA